MKIKLDENLSRHLKQELIDSGHDVLTALDEGLLGKSDVEIAAAAKEEDRFTFTLDLDFGDIRKFPPGTHPGIILFRPKSMGPRAVSRFILQFVQSTNLAEFSKCVVIVEPTRVRVRRFYAI